MYETLLTQALESRARPAPDQPSGQHRPAPGPRGTTLLTTHQVSRLGNQLWSSSSLASRGDATAGSAAHRYPSQGDKSWSDLCSAAGMPMLAQGPHEPVLRRAIGRLLHVDDVERLSAFQELMASGACHDVAHLGERKQRLLRMLVASLADQVIDKTVGLQAACELVWQHPQVLAELRELFGVLSQRVAHLPYLTHTISVRTATCAPALLG